MLLLELFELVYVRVREVLPDLRLAPIAEALEVPLVGAVHLRHDSRDGWLLPLAARAGRVVLLDEVVETEALHVLLEPLSDQVGALEVVLSCTPSFSSGRPRGRARRMWSLPQSVVCNVIPEA